MKKVDLTKTLKSYYSAISTPQLVDIEAANFASICGQGDPDGPNFAQAVQQLYTVMYALKFRYKSLLKDFIVPKLEGLWYFDMEKYADIAMQDAPKLIPRSEWQYRLLIRLPDFVERSEWEAAIVKANQKLSSPSGVDVHWFEMQEGKSVQLLHTGPFSTEPESLKKKAVFMTQNGLTHNGDHHEIYLSDFRKTAPEKLRTILRTPVK